MHMHKNTITSTLQADANHKKFMSELYNSINYIEVSLIIRHHNKLNSHASTDILLQSFFHTFTMQMMNHTFTMQTMDTAQLGTADNDMN